MHDRQERAAASRRVGMTARTNGQEAAMTPARHKISFGLVLAAIVSSLVLAAGAGARVLPEPGAGSPVTKVHRSPAVKKAVRRALGGFPSQSGKHVRVDKELATE
jgi:hypothetical protein